MAAPPADHRRQAPLQAEQQQRWSNDRPGGSKHWQLIVSGMLLLLWIAFLAWTALI